MKSLRRSLNNNNSNVNSSPAFSPPLPTFSGVGTPLPIGRPSEKVAPPQKVIKALVSHRSTNPQELSYTKGDFWYVTGEREGWYEALNPLTNSRGLVPKSDFEEFGKGGKASAGLGGRQEPSNDSRSLASSGRQSQSSNPRSPPSAPFSPPSSAQPKKGKQPVYAIVQYDFIAERPDELDAKKGEPIVVMAQSNHEWFVAKPIGRLGGPGLIPVAFVEIRDPATGKPIDVLPDSIPMVEEWKKATADYKAAAIPLGKFDFPSDQAVQNSPYAASPSPYLPNQSPIQQSTGGGLGHRSQSSIDGGASQSSSGRKKEGGGVSPIYRPEQDPYLPLGEFTGLAVPSFHNESGNYWFRLQVAFSPDDRRAPNFTLLLYRTYEDFYDFQISLLDTFPHEAGRPAIGEEDMTPPERILPYMPGPVEDEIDDELTEYRREELDAYVKALVDLKDRGAEYISRHELFRGFFAAKYGDYCEEVPRQDSMEELDEGLGGMKISEGERERAGYIVDTRATSAASRHSQHDRDRYSPSNTRPGGNSGGTPLQHSTSRGPSPLPPIDAHVRPGSSNHNYSNHQIPSASTTRQSAGGPSTAATNTGHYLSGGPSTAATASSWSAGPMSSAGQQIQQQQQQQPPFIKIKIYDRATDDLIAIRVHPNVSHSELLDKVRSRLGPEIQLLRCRVSGGGNAYHDIRDDRELKEWIHGEDQKLVLYAEQ